MALTNMEQEVAPTVTFMSYNSTGLSSVKCQWVQEISSENDVDYISIQEHFKQSSKSLDKYFRNNFSDYHSYIIPAFRSPGQDSGRVRAGLAQLSRKSISVKKERVVSRSFRIQAQVLNLPSSRLLWINTYLPTDPQRANYDDTELCEVLEEVEKILTGVAYTDVLWTGDLNWDMGRTTQFSRNMHRFMEKMGLVSLWSQHPVDFTHIHTDNKSVSTVDHFIVNPRLLPLVADCGVIHRGDNLSRHSPIWVRLNLGSLPLRNTMKSTVPRKPSWPKASAENIEEYTSALEAKLKKLEISRGLLCTDPNCKEQQHTQDRDSLTLDILMAMIETSYNTLPMCGGRRVSSKVKSGCKAVPGWVEHVEPFRVESRYWHRVWLREGRPNNNWLHATMIKKRAGYHYAVRRLKKQADLVRAKKLFEASLKGDLDLLKEMKAVRSGSGGQAELPDTVAGANGPAEIVDKFREVYNALYNSAGTKEEMDRLQNRVAELIRVDSMEEICKVTGSKVKEAVSMMKPCKGDVSEGYTSDALLNGPDILFDHLAIIFRSWLVHGTVSKSLLACAFLPLLKSSLKDPADTGSYRAIAGSSLLLKLFEKLILLIWGEYLSSDSLQFGFKAGTSTTQCTWLVQEVVGHFLRNGSHPILTVLDCSKASDTCKFSVLFTKLLDAGLPPVVIRVLMFVYQEQFAWVKWGDTKSDLFTIINGTRQGSMISPALWSIYLDMLIKELRELGVGCHVGGLFMGVVGYADDLLLMAPTRRAMQAMLDKCEEYASDHNILFSTDPDPSKSKTKCIFVCGDQKKLAKPATLTLCGRDLPWVSTASHLGHELSETGNMEQDVKEKRATFISKSVEVRETFKFASPVEVVQAMKVYCSSFYGCMLWDLSGQGAAQVFNSWNTAAKLAWSVPRATRTFLLQQVLTAGVTSAKVDILARYRNFFHGLRRSPCYEVSVMANIASRDLRSTTGSNIRFVEQVSGLDLWSCNYFELKEALKQNEMVDVPILDQWRIKYLDTLLSQRQELHYIGASVEEERVAELITALCTT